ncbi:MAG: 4Fe-4S dicluster domain-containing protein, partial [Actinobacteria bacterium]|nr:4Fe-4S dicluster domain-containing protein [Actinomycetota bacterium]
CYQCKKCSVGCPVCFAMDLLPHEVMKMVQYGQEDRVLKSATIWICASCETCSTRCPNDIDIARVMDGLRETALEKGVEPAEPDVKSMHSAFLASIRLFGKINEPVLIGGYKVLSRNLFDDLGMAVKMVIKGKVKPKLRMVKDRRAVRRIFRKSRQESKRS